MSIFLKKEERLNLCVPGGKDTTRTLKALYDEIADAPAVAEARRFAHRSWSRPRHTCRPSAAARATTRRRRLFHSRTRLNKPGSEKETWHIELDLAETGLDYAVGDSFGLYPSNDPALVDAVITAIHAPADFLDRGAALARRADDERLAQPGAGYAVSAHLLRHRRRAAAEGQGARFRRRPRWRRRHARCARGNREISRHSARARSVRRGAGSACSRASIPSLPRSKAIRAAWR